MVGDQPIENVGDLERVLAMAVSNLERLTAHEDQRLRRIEQLLERLLPKTSPPPERAADRCTFCGKGKDQVARLIAGPGVYICNECVELCMEIMDEEGVPADRP